MEESLVLVGCGKMGGAMLEGWLAGGLAPERVRIVEPGTPAVDRKDLTVVDGAEALDRDFPADIVVLAVKPQVMAAVAPAYARFADAGAVVLSIAAGQTVATLSGHLGARAAIVRSMPNTPAAVGRGISVGYANDQVSADQRALCDRLLAAVGEVGWVDDEALLDAVTGVSGSGPAYVFFLTECLAEAGVEAGLDRELATRLARATVAGAGELMRLSGEDAAVLRRNVTSPKGTTEAGLGVLMADDGLRPLIARTVAAAARRSAELAS